MLAQVDASKFTGSTEAITIWDAKRLNQFRSNPMSLYLYQIIDEMGQGSRVAQGLSAVLTSVKRLQENPTNRLYLLSRGNLCLGLLKTGKKKLFIRGKSGNWNEIEPLCVLDFYVHESQQRSGYGKVLFEYMLACERVYPHQLGIDRPSPKFLGFLRKHYGLSDFIPQSNNFVVFNQYFDGPVMKQGAAAFSQDGGGLPPVPTVTQPVMQAYEQPSTTATTSSNAIVLNNSRLQHNHQQHVSLGRNDSVGQLDPSSPPQPRSAIPLPSHERHNTINIRMAAHGDVPLAATASMLPSKTIGGLEKGGMSEVLSASQRNAASRNRETSPTRSCVQYNIITLQDSPGGRTTPTPQPLQHLPQPTYVQQSVRQPQPVYGRRQR